MRTRAVSLLLVVATLAALEARSQSVRVNEAVSSNASAFVDEDGEASDWIELYNLGADPVRLGGYGLSDRPDEPFRWIVPDVEIPAGGYLVVFASGKDRRGLEGLWRTVIRRGDTWRYAPGASSIPSTWNRSGFDDGAWSQGPSGLGYGDGDDATTVGTTLSLYARTRFQVDDPAQVAGAELHVDYDDAFVAYVNGVEVARAGIGVPGQAPPHNQPAASGNEARLYQGLPVHGQRVDTTAFVAGENVLAVQVHNVSRFSSDLSLIPFLTLGTLASATDYSGVDPEIVSDFDRELHASYRLSDQETVCLTVPDGSTMDCLELQPVADGVSVGRLEDGTTGLFGQPTPGAANEDGATAIGPEVLIEPPDGLVSAGTGITISSATSGRIRYTLDGSEPVAISALYVGPIVLNEDVVVRARSFDAGLLPGPIATRTYLVDAPLRLPTVSITTEPDLLFHPETGLYVRGPGASGSFPYFGANFWEDREIPVDVEWLDTDGTRGFSQKLGLKIFGGWSRGQAQKSFSLFARNRYDTPAIEQRLFPLRSYSSFQAIVLRNSGNDWGRSMLRDGFMHQLVQGTAIDALAYRPTRVLVNGDYWGIQNLREKINEHYVAAVGGVDADEIDLLEFNDEFNGANAIHGTLDAYQLLLDRLAEADVTTSDAYAELGALMDLDNYIDYQIAQIFFDNRDWPGNNQKVWRERSSDGRFRWILFDTDFGWGIWDSGAWRENTLLFALDANGPSWPNPPWSTWVFRRLMLNQEFRMAFANRFADMVNVHFEVDRVGAVLSELARDISAEIPAHEARWGLAVDWGSEILDMHRFARARPPVMTDHVRAYLNLGAGSPITVTAGDGGRVRVNRETLTGTWTGTYFNGLPVPVTAEPLAGYRFDRWSGSHTGSERTISVNPADAVSLVAHFEPDATDPAALVINEVHYNPAGLSGEWIEIVNAGPSIVQTENWTLADSTGAFVLPSRALEPGGLMVACQDPTAFSRAYGGRECAGPWPFRLSNGGEVVWLRDPAGAMADSVAYRDIPPWPSEADGGGRSLELIDPSSDNAQASSWRPSAWAGGSPGFPNSVGVGLDEVGLPDAVSMTGFPNPFRNDYSVQLTLPEAGEVRLEVFDVLGRRVALVHPGIMSPGRHVLYPLRADIAPGMYLVRLMLDDTPAGALSAIRLH